ALLGHADRVGGRRSRLRAGRHLCQLLARQRTRADHRADPDGRVRSGAALAGGQAKATDLGLSLRRSIRGLWTPAARPQGSGIVCPQGSQAGVLAAMEAVMATRRSSGIGLGRLVSFATWTCTRNPVAAA